MQESSFIRYPIESSLSLTTKFVLYPLTMYEVMVALKNNEFEINPQVAMSIPANGSLLGKHQIGFKGTNTITMDADLQMIGVNGSIPDSVLDTFLELEKILINLVPNINSCPFYYETVSRYYIKTKKIPLKTIGRISFSDNQLGNFENIFKQKMKLFGFQLCSESDTVNQSNWFNISVHPLGNKSENTFFFESVFRSEDKNKTQSQLNNIENRIDELFEFMEDY